MRIAYFVHDLADAAVHRRVRMLKPFADITLLGFRRTEAPIEAVEGLSPIDLGRTANARMGQRVAMVLQAAVNSRRWQAGLGEVTVFMARQLEMLSLATLVRRRVAPAAPLVFECLDIHRLMLAKGAAGVVLRALEGRMLRSSDALIVSSPAFLTHHFNRYGANCPRSILLENKVLEAEIPHEARACIDTARVTGPPLGPPWRIGWFGVIRCRRSLHLLADLVRGLPGRVEIVIRGRPSRNVVPDFDEVVAATPGLSFLGAYDRYADLAGMYGDVHFTWAMDFYEAGANSDWLLPNRLYEGSLYGAVPIALNSVETGRWLERRDAGIRLDETPARPLGQMLLDFFARLDGAAYQSARSALARIPLSDLVEDAAGGARLADTLAAAGARRAIASSEPLRSGGRA